MDTVKTLVTSPTVRRLLALALGAIVVALNKRLGLQLDTAEVAGLVALILGYLAQSAAVDRARILGEAQTAADTAAAGVGTLSDAARVLGPPP